jgi:ribosome-binding factor A
MPEGRGPRRYSRLDRVNQALREVIADELELLDDDRLHLVTVTGIRVEADLRRAVVWFSSLSAGRSAAEVVDALGAHRVRLQAAVARQLRLKRTPELTFQSDPAIAVGTRVEKILERLDRRGESDMPAAGAGSGGPQAEGDE